MASPNRNWMDWSLLLCVNGTVPGILIWKLRSGAVTPTVAIVSGLVCLLVLNCVLLASFRARGERGGQPNSRVKVLGVVGFALLATSVLIAAVFVIPERNRYLDLAMSNVPLSSIQPERDRLVVELIRQRSANSRDYDNLLVEAQKHLLSPALYTPESFASEQIMRSTVEQLTKYSDIDFEYFQKQQKAFTDFQEKMQTVDTAYLASMQVERKGQEAAEQSANRLEHAWLESVNSLYGFAESHSKEISLENGHLVFATDAVKLEFNEKLDKSKILYQKWQDVTQGLIREHEQTRAKVVSP